MCYSGINRKTLQRTEHPSNPAFTTVTGNELAQCRDKCIYTGCGLMGVYHCDVCGRSVGDVQLCILRQETYSRHQRTQRTGTRPVAAKPAREESLCPLSYVEQTVFPSHFQWLQLRAKPIMKMTVNYIQDVHMKVSKRWITPYGVWEVEN